MTAPADQTWTALGALQWTTEYFGRKGCDSPRLDAELLLAHTLGIERIQLYVQYERPLAAEERERYRGFVRRRGGGEPVAYILGEREFWSLPFEVGPGVLIPRPDTETLVEQALLLATEISPEGQPPLRIADVGTGSGCVAIALASERPDAHVWAGDVADAPIEIATRNAARSDVAQRVSLVRGPGLPPLHAAAGSQPFHLVVSNPPYIPAGELEGLMRDVRDHEPHGALIAGPEGLDVIAPLIRDAAASGSLAPGGALLIEIGSSTQAEMTVGLMQSAGFGNTWIAPDLGNRSRVVVGRLLEG